MEKYKEFLGIRTKQVKRKLITMQEAMNNCYGYLLCMVDNGIITNKELCDECDEMVKKLLEAEHGVDERKQNMMRKWLGGESK